MIYQNVNYANERGIEGGPLFAYRDFRFLKLRFQTSFFSDWGTTAYFFWSHPKDLWRTAMYLLQVVSQESLPQLSCSQGWAGDFWPVQDSNPGTLA